MQLALRNRNLQNGSTLAFLEKKQFINLQYAEKKRVIAMRKTSFWLVLLCFCLPLNSFGQTAEIDTNIRVNLEEPAAAVSYGGISNLRGWAVSPDGIDRVEIFIDGDYVYEVPMGGSRGDVGSAFPDYPGSDKSGFSAAFNYKSLSRGMHTMTARAYANSGDYNESSNIFFTLKFSAEFISSLDAIDLRSTEGVAILGPTSFSFSGVSVEGSQWDVDFDWDRETQGFEIIDVRPYQETPECLDLTGSWALEVAGASVAQGGGIRIPNTYYNTTLATVTQDGCYGIYKGENGIPIDYAIYANVFYGRASSQTVGLLVSEYIEDLVFQYTGYASSARARFAIAEATGEVIGGNVEGTQAIAAAGTVSIAGYSYTWVYIDRADIRGSR